VKKGNFENPPQKAVEGQLPQSGKDVRGVEGAFGNEPTPTSGAGRRDGKSTGNREPASEKRGFTQGKPGHGGLPPKG